jgi:pilus assembly protein CpaB
MNRNLIIVMSGGAIVAILVAFLMQAVMSDQGGGKKVKKKAPMAEVLVAARDKQLGQTLSSADLRWQKWPEDAVFDEAIVRKGDEAPTSRLSGRLVRNISEGMPVLKSYVSGDTGQNILATRMKEGERAVAINVDAASMAGGFILPGDNVDVLLTYEMRIRREDTQLLSTLINQRAAETVLENVEVLATGQQAIKEGGEANVERTVTLAVAPKQAEALTLASKMGDLSLALRPIGDKKLKKVDEGDDAVSQFMNERVKRLRKKFDSMTTDVGIATVMRSVNAVKNRDGAMRVYSGGNVVDVTTRQ